MQTLIKEVQAVVQHHPVTYVFHIVNDPEPIPHLPSSSMVTMCLHSALPHPSIDPDELEDED